MDAYPAVKPEDVLDEIVGALEVFGKHRQVRFQVLVENANGFSRLLIWGVAEPGSDRSTLFYQPDSQQPPKRSEEYRHSALHGHLHRLLLGSIEGSDLYEIVIEIPYPDQALAPAGQLRWNMGRGQILLGRMH